jgi:hypothetical protein
LRNQAAQRQVFIASTVEGQREDPSSVAYPKHTLLALVVLLAHNAMYTYVDDMPLVKKDVSVSHQLVYIQNVHIHTL